MDDGHDRHDHDDDDAISRYTKQKILVVNFFPTNTSLLSIQH
jgi:hypothetical protein